MDDRGNRLYSGDVVYEVRSNGKCRRFKSLLECEQHIFALGQMNRSYEIVRKIWR